MIAANIHISTGSKAISASAAVMGGAPIVSRICSRSPTIGTVPDTPSTRGDGSYSSCNIIVRSRCSRVRSISSAVPWR